MATVGSRGGCVGVPGGWAWLGTGGARALVPRRPILETPSDRGLLGQAAGNSGDQGCTFA